MTSDQLSNVIAGLVLLAIVVFGILYDESKRP